MAKPILIVRIPLNQRKNSEKIHENWISSDIAKEYHVITVIDELIDSVQFECYNTNETEEVKIDDLKERLTILMESALYRIKEANRIEKEQKIQKIEEEEKALTKAALEKTFREQRPWHSRIFPKYQINDDDLYTGPKY